MIKSSRLFIFLCTGVYSFCCSALYCQVGQVSKLTLLNTDGYVFRCCSSSRGIIYTSHHHPTPQHLHTPKTYPLSKAYTFPETYLSPNKISASAKQFQQNKLPIRPRQRSRVATLPKLTHFPKHTCSQDNHANKSIIYLVSKKPHLPFGLIIIRSLQRPYLPLRGFSKYGLYKSPNSPKQTYSFNETPSVPPETVSEFHRTPNGLIKTIKHRNKNLKWLAEGFSAFYDF